MAQPIVFTKTLAAAATTGIAQSQSPATAALTLNGSLVTAGVALLDAVTSTNLAIGRRVIVTSGGNDTGIKWIVVGTNSTGNPITDVFSGASGGAAQSNLDFVTVTSITPSGSVATTATAGTNGVGSSPWQTMNWHVTSVMNITVAVELVTGSAGYTVEYTLDDPNNLLGGATVPLNLSDLSPTNLVAASATKDGLFNFPLAALRLTINSGTGTLLTRIMQSSIG